jgi:signal transduction histidine kinase
MKNTNEFMVMTINRCIDYTKASNGVKLIPRLDTFDFIQALKLPIRCMKSLLNKKTTIKLLPISHNIARNIITDKQWLQENVLCLLSNAVKYSVGGLVTVSATLQSAGVTTTQVIRIEVEDSGIGISDAIRSNLFAQFKQAQRLAGGTGLGMYF